MTNHRSQPAAGPQPPGADTSRNLPHADAMRLLRRDDEETPVSADVKASVLRAWDARHRAMPPGRPAAAAVIYRAPRPSTPAATVRAALTLAAACLVAVAAATWRNGVPESVAVERQGPALDIVDETPAAFLSAADVALGDEPSTLQIVRLSVDPAVLIAYGYALADVSTTGPVPVEMVVGVDGVPRAIRALQGTTHE